ncbi:cadherin-like domain-containing protein [Oscillatoria sp. CS-180]|uniref:cadherin-like domain-containing protein n=1 Tax=Oscillatoria sp. CS-180 TaxID=3021720 RepID=UPI00232E9042|nr:cadherin-like domain-containing protein [Oscillatoria sp. CS-180]MDB9528276.1 cadherin-like domain-containing protein [Oscillatoria sp. CS-180]
MAAPQITTNRLDIEEGQNIPVSTSELNASAPGVSTNDIRFEIIPAVGAGGESLLAGSFLLDGAPTTNFSLEEILQGRVDFSHDRSNVAPQYTVVASAAGEVSEASAPEIVFVARNDSPIFSINALSISEGETVTLNAIAEAPNLVTTDEESPPEQLTYEILSVSNGNFQIGVGETATELGVADRFTQADVNAGLIAFKHDGSETAPNYSLRVIDTGIADDPTPKGTSREVALQNFAQINDVPVITANGIALTEGATVRLNSQNIAATDVEDDDAALALVITSVTGGRFELLDPAGNVVSVLASPDTEPVPFSQNSILQGLVQFVNDPATDTPPTYTLQVSDSGIPDPVQVATDEAEILFTAVNDLPLPQIVSLIIAENQTVPLTGENLQVIDEETPPDALAYQVNEVVAGRFVRIADGTTVTAFTQAEINAGNVIAFEHDGSPVAPAFTLAVADGGGNVIEISSGDGIQFQAFNDLPVVQRSQLTLTEGQTVTLTSAENLQVLDEESSPAELIYTVQIANADPAKPDRFIINGVETLEPTVTFTQADVNAGLVQFVHGGSNVAPNLTLSVTDTALSDTDAPNPPVPLDFVVTFQATNDEPIFAVNTLSITEGGTVVLNSIEPNLVTTDEESPATELTYTIDSFSDGTFQSLGGDAPANLAIGSTFTQADVDNGLIQFTHNGSEIPPAYRLTVTDTGINGDPGTVLGVARDLQIPDGGFVTTNDPPVLVNNTLTLSEGDIIVLDSDNLSATDPEDNDADLQFTVTNIVNGRFERVTLVGGVEQIEVLASPDLPTPISFSQDQILQGQIRFVNDPATNAAPSYTVTVSDLTTPPLVDSRDAEILYTPRNDAPLFSVNTLTIAENATVVLNSNPEAPNLVTTDEETPPEGLTYTIDGFSNGMFQLLGGEAPVDLAIGSTFTQADVNNGLVQFMHNGSELAPSYNLTVSDTGLDGDPATIESVSRTVEIPDGGFILVNDPPILGNNQITLSEGDMVVLTLENLSAADVESDDNALLFTVTQVTNGRFERVTIVNGEEQVEVLAAPDFAPPISFNQAEIAQGQIRFVNDPAIDEPPTYTVELRDLDPESPLSVIGDGVVNFTALNDEPQLAAFSLTLREGDTIALTPEVLSVVDEELPPEAVTYTVDAVTGGRFVRVADASDATSFTQAEINAGNVIAFEHDGGNAAPTFSLTVNDDVNTLIITDQTEPGVIFTSVNDAPLVGASAFDVEEGGRVVLTEALLSTTDEETPPEELVYTVAIANADPNQPDGFEINGQLLTDPAVAFSQAQVNAGQVAFVHGGSNFAPDLTVTVVDTLNSDEGEPIPVEVDLQVGFIAFNDMPIVTNTLRISEGETVTLTPEFLLAGDEETPPEGLIYTIEAVLNGSFQAFDPGQGKAVGPLDVGSIFSQADVNGGAIQFVHNGDEAAPSYTLTVTDTPLVPGEEPNSVSSTVEIPEGGFVNLNDNPALEANTLTIEEGGTAVFTKSNLLAADPDSNLSQVTFEITDVQGGTFFLRGTELIEGKTFTTAAVSFGELSFTDDGDELAPSYSVIVRDVEGGMAEPVPATIEFIPLNDPPELTANTFEITEGQRLTLNDPTTGVINLQATDAEVAAPEAITFEVSNVVGGTFVDFFAQPINQFTQAELNAGNIIFAHDGSETPPTFDITVFDNGGEPVVVPANVIFTPVNDGPTLVNNQLTVTEGVGTPVTLENFSAADADTPPDVLTFVITELQGGGFAIREGDALIPTTTFTQGQLAAGVVEFVDDGDQVPPSFNISVSDGEIQTDPVAAVIGELINTNDPPVAVDDGGEGFITNEQTAFTMASVLANDIDEDPGDSETLAVIQLNGQAATEGVPIALPSGAVISFASGGNINYDPNGQFVALVSGQSAADSFTYTITDSSGATSTATVNIEIAGIDNTPTLDLNRLSISRGQTLVLSGINLSASDADTPPEALTFTVSDVVGGEFLLNGAATESFSQQDLLNGTVSFVQDGSETSPAYNIVVSDGSTSTEPLAVTVDQFVPVNIGAIAGGVLDYEQFLRLQNPDAVIPVDSINDLPIAQFFDEQFYLTQNPDIGQAVGAGTFSSGFEHFLTAGIAEGRNPSVLYNEDFYLGTNEDIVIAIANNMVQSGLEHFLLTGAFELRSPSSQFTQTEYLDENVDIQNAVRDGVFNSGFQHYILQGANENRSPALYLYNEEFYLSNNPTVAADVQNGLFTDGFEHFVSFGQIEGRQPSILYNEASYLGLNPDVGAAIANGSFTSGFDHYVEIGRFEGRTVFA